jgi:phosphatidylinositol glycan class B
LLNPGDWSYRTLLFAGLAVYTLTAFASQGYLQSDEHFQVLEFADYKLGITPAADLPWEFQQQIRPALQPALALGVIQLARAGGLFNPFMQAFLLRLITAVLAILLYAWMSHRFPPDSSDESAGRMLLALTILLWFVPTLSVRFSSENWSGLAFLAGLGLLLLASPDDRRSALRSGAAGLLLGLSFVFRFQMVFAIAGVAAWLALHRHVRRTHAAAIIAGGLGAVAIGIAADHWFYGNLVFTQWQYFQANVLQGKAAKFGVSPWWFYLPTFVMAAIPPISLVLLLLVGYGVYRNARHVFTWALIPFVLAHVLVGHKELRFLFPMLFPFLWLVVAGWKGWHSRVSSGNVMKTGLAVCVVINLIALVFVSARARQQAVPCWQFLYDYSRDRDVVLYAEGSSPYESGILRSHFYQAPALTVKVVRSLAELSHGARSELRVGDLLLQRHLAAPPIIPGYRVERAFRAFPDWIVRLDITHWQERTEIWTLYRVAARS